MGYEARRAHRFYEQAWAALPPQDARQLVGAEIMGRIYFALLRAIEARQFRVFGEPVTLPMSRKLAIALSCWVRARLGRAASP